MSTILKIFRSDMKGLSRNFFALVVAAALCILPALYAWFNIYANWDPYGNTGNIKIAVVDLDEGWTSPETGYINIGGEIEADLQTKDSIGWEFVDTEEEAIDGVRKGQYYAAVVMNADLSKSIISGPITDSEDVSSSMKYYVNGKKNAVATKITDTAVENLQESITKQYITVNVSQYLTTIDASAADIDAAGQIDSIIQQLEQVNTDLKSYETTIRSFVDANELLKGSTADGQAKIEKNKKVLDSGKNQLNDAASKLDSGTDTFNSFSSDLNTTVQTVQEDLKSLSDKLNSLQNNENAEKVKTDLQEIHDAAAGLTVKLNKLEDALRILAKDNSDLEAVITSIDNTKQIIADIESNTQDLLSQNDFSGLGASLNKTANDIAKAYAIYTDSVVPQINDVLKNMSGSLDSIIALMNGMGDLSGNLETVFGTVTDSMGVLNKSMAELCDTLSETSEKIDDTLNQLHNASDSDKIRILSDLFTGDISSIAEFFREPVLIHENAVFEIDNYGSSMSPFYTILAIWVGMTILVSVIKVHTDKNQLDDPKNYEMFFGRYLLFFLLSQIQTLVIVLGDLYIFHIQCLHPFLFWLAAAASSLAISLLVYSLTISFGDIGKAIAVIIMVMQIAGSGGTFPMESLPGFFRAVYVFFPFPYGIDAMRECIGGMYGTKYLFCMGRLGLFVLAALVIGLVIRLPFISMNHYFEKRMKDTDLM